MRRTRQNKTKSAAPALNASILLVLAIGGGLLCLHFWDKVPDNADLPRTENGNDEIPGQISVVYQGEEYRLRDELDCFLIIGLDKFTTTTSDPEFFLNNQQADFLLLMIVDKDSSSYCALHLNRDTMAEIQRLGLGGKKLDLFYGQLALAHTYGSGGKDSCRNTVEAVSRFLYGVPIDHYLSLTMDAIPVLNDLAGGVTVHVGDDFSAVDPSLEQGKDVHLMGQQALTYIRARGGMNEPTNLNRMARQREYINALYKQLSQKMRESDGFGRRMATQMADYSVSDLTTSELSRFAEQFKDYSFLGIYTVPGEAVLGERFMEYYADDDALQELVIRLFFKKA